jgi:hypothetical protein
MHIPALNNEGKAFDLFESVIGQTSISKLLIRLIKILARRLPGPGSPTLSRPSVHAGASGNRAGRTLGDGVRRVEKGRMRNDGGLG